MIADLEGKGGVQFKRLGDIINDQQADKVVEILNTVDEPIKRVRALTEYFLTIRSELESKGFDPHYLAWMVVLELSLPR